MRPGAARHPLGDRRRRDALTVRPGPLAGRRPPAHPAAPNGPPNGLTPGDPQPGFAPAGPDAPVPLGGPAAEAAAAGELRYGPALREYRAQQQASVQQQQNIRDWYRDYQDQLEELAQESERAYGREAKKAGKEARRGAKAAGEAGAALNAGEDASAAIRAATPGAEGRLAGAQGIAQGLAAGADFAGHLRAEGLNQAGFTRDRARIAALDGFTRLAQEFQRHQGLGRRIADTEGERGAYETTTRADLADRARKARLEEMVFERELGEGIRDDQRQDRENEQQAGMTRERLELERERVRIAQQNADANTTRSAAGSGSRPMTPAQSSKVKARIDRAWTVFKNLPTKEWARALQEMTSGATLGGTLPSVSPLEARAARELVGQSRLNSNTYHELLGTGFRVPREWMPRRQ